MTYPARLGEGVVYVTPNHQKRWALVVADPCERSDGTLSTDAELAIYTRGNLDSDWLLGNEGPERDIRNQARLLVRRSQVPYDSTCEKPHSWHWRGDEK
jgi:hypothetical protein